MLPRHRVVAICACLALLTAALSERPTTRSALTSRFSSRPRIAAPCSRITARPSRGCGFSRTTATTGSGCGFSTPPRSFPTTFRTRSRWPSRRGGLGSSSCSTITTPTPGPTRASSTFPRPGRESRTTNWLSAVFEYTRDTIAAFREAGVMPDMVQIGNEVIGGMLWPDGRLPDHWDHFADLVKAGIRGVEAGRGDGPRPKIMIHIDRGGDKPGTKSLLRQASFLRRGIRRDRPVLLSLVARHACWTCARTWTSWPPTYHKDIMLVEVAYCWRPTEYRSKPAPFPETPEGQRDFLDEVNRIVLDTPRPSRHRHLLVGAGRDGTSPQPELL